MVENFKFYVKGLVTVCVFSTFHLLNVISSMKKYTSNLMGDSQTESSIEIITELNGRISSLYLIVIGLLIILLFSADYYRKLIKN